MNSDSKIGYGIAIGAINRAVIGVVMDSIALWIGVGVALGIALGVAWDRAEW